ncbi:hypothetical protein D3C75_310360 [compost metagenome]
MGGVFVWKLLSGLVVEPVQLHGRDRRVGEYGSHFCLPGWSPPVRRFRKSRFCVGAGGARAGCCRFPVLEFPSSANFHGRCRQRIPGYNAGFSVIASSVGKPRLVLGMADSPGSLHCRRDMHAFRSTD